MFLWNRPGFRTFTAVLTLSPAIGLIISGLIMIPGFILGQNKNIPEKKHKHAHKAGSKLANVYTSLTHPFTLLSHFHPPTLDSLGHFAKNWKKQLRPFYFNMDAQQY